MTGAATGRGLDALVARGWVDRFERTQERYSEHRDERRRVVRSVVAESLADGPPVVVELGAGTGTLASAFLADRPDAEVVAVEPDPWLRALAVATVPSEVRLVDVVAGAPGWVVQVTDRPAHAVVADAVLHYLDDATLLTVLRDVRGLLHPDGALVVADHAADLDPTARTEGAPGATVNESMGEADTWTQWWAALTADPAVRAVVDAPARPALDGDVPRSLDELRGALLDAGFVSVDVAWQRSRSVVIAARPGPRPPT